MYLLLSFLFLAEPTNEDLFEQLNNFHYTVREKATKELIDREAIDFILNKQTQPMPVESSLRCKYIVKQIFLKNNIHQFKGDWKKIINDNIAELNDKPYKKTVYAIIHSVKIYNFEFAAKHCCIPFNLPSRGDPNNPNVVISNEKKDVESHWKFSLEQILNFGANLNKVESVLINNEHAKAILQGKGITPEKGEIIVDIKFEQGNNVHIFMIIKEIDGIWYVKSSVVW